MSQKRPRLNASYIDKLGLDVLVNIISYLTERYDHLYFDNSGKPIHTMVMAARACRALRKANGIWTSRLNIHLHVNHRSHLHRSLILSTLANYGRNIIEVTVCHQLDANYYMPSVLHFRYAETKSFTWLASECLHFNPVSITYDYHPQHWELVRHHNLELLTFQDCFATISLMNRRGARQLEMEDYIHGVMYHYKVNLHDAPMLRVSNIRLDGCCFCGVRGISKFCLRCMYCLNNPPSTDCG